MIKASSVQFVKLDTPDYSLPIVSHCLKEYLQHRPLDNERIDPKETVTNGNKKALKN